MSVFKTVPNRMSRSGLRSGRVQSVPRQRAQNRVPKGRYCARKALSHRVQYWLIDLYQYGGMTKTKARSAAEDKAIVARVAKEMGEPRLAESARKEIYGTGGSPSAATFEKPILARANDVKK